MNTEAKGIVMIIVGFLISTIQTEVYAQDPVTEAIKAGVTKVIKAIDLKIQRFQNETIWLQNAQKVVENKMSALKLAQISDWAEKQKTLYADYFDELWKVKNVVAYYHRIRDVTRKQLDLVNEYKHAYALFKKDQHFSADEIQYMGEVYTEIINQSLDNIDQLFLVINSLSTQMSDAKRLQIIDAVADQVDEHYKNLKSFNDQGILLSLQRAKAGNDIERVRELYCIN